MFRCPGPASVSGGGHALTTLGTSAAPPPCPVPGCYPGYYAGHIAVACTFSTRATGPKRPHTITSGNGTAWTAATLVNSGGDSNFPQLAAGPAPGDFRLAWQDNRTGAFSTWYTTSADGGASRAGQVKPSDRTPGAPYKSPAGHTVPDGDYFAIAVSSAGITYATWGEADGSTVYCCGDTWYTHGP